MKAHEYWFSRYGVRRNPGIFYVFLHFKNNFKKLLKSCPILSLPIQRLHYSKILSSNCGEDWVECCSQLQAY